jgi:drug/metabolite transporter (DMT)-like permease
MVKIYIVLTIAVLTQATGNVLLSKGMKYAASAAQTGGGYMLSLPFHAIGNPLILAGTAFSIIFYILFAVALSWADLTLVLPVISVEIIANVAFAEYFLNESVPPVRWIGTVLIAAGVALVLRSERAANEDTA